MIFYEGSQKKKKSFEFFDIAVFFLVSNFFFPRLSLVRDVKVDDGTSFTTREEDVGPTKLD